MIDEGQRDEQDGGIMDILSDYDFIQDDLFSFLDVQPMCMSDVLFTTKIY